jgi:hypothetical protein
VPSVIDCPIEVPGALALKKLLKSLRVSKRTRDLENSAAATAIAEELALASLLEVNDADYSEDGHEPLAWTEEDIEDIMD